MLIQRFNVEIYARDDGRKLYNKYHAKIGDKCQADMVEEILHEVESSANLKRAIRYRTKARTALENLDIRITPV